MVCEMGEFGAVFFYRYGCCTLIGLQPLNKSRLTSGVFKESACDDFRIILGVASIARTLLTPLGYWHRWIMDDYKNMMTLISDKNIMTINVDKTMMLLLTTMITMLLLLP